MNKEKEYELNSVLDRFSEAVDFHELIKVIKLRFHKNPALPILVQLIENERNAAFELGLEECQRYGLFRKQELVSTSGNVSSNT